MLRRGRCRLKMWGAGPLWWGAMSLGVSLAAAVSGCSPLPESPEESLLRSRCAGCHSYDNALRKRKSARGWERTVWAMRQRGAELTDQEAEQLVRYLARERSP